MRVEEKKLGGFNTKMISMNDIVVGIATDMGPRVLYAASGRRPDFNLFGVLPKGGVETPEGFWKIYGGHRLWSSPEAKPRSYSLDDKRVKIVTKEDSVTVCGNPEHENSVLKEISMTPLPKRGIQVTHTIKNIGRWPIKLGCWALSVMRQNGFAVIPLKPLKVDEEGLLPDRHISLWPYADLSDERLTFTDKYLFVRQNPGVERPLKIGTMANPTWTAYWVDGMAFVKQFSREEGDYPDFGCNVEVYTNPDMLELETVGPLKILNPSDSVHHTEMWKIIEARELTPEPKSIREKLEASL